MRRLAGLLVPALGLLLLAGLPGCDSCSGEARRYIEQGDSILSKYATQAEPLLHDLEGLFTDYAAGVNTEPAGVQARTAEYGAAAKGLTTRAGEARAAYDKALGLKVTGAYADYVKQRLAVAGEMEKIPGAAEGGFRAINTLGDSHSAAGANALETELYKASRKLIQITV